MSEEKGKLVICKSCARILNKPKDCLSCDWCPDDSCTCYWQVKVFNTVHTICNCCYERLKKIVPETRQDTQEDEEGRK